MTELCYLTAIEQQALIRKGEISARELCEAHLNQIDQVNGQVNAIVTLVPQQALAKADAVDLALARGDDPGILAGLPTAHKDLVQTAGIRTTFGSRLYADYIPESDDLIAARMKAAGAVTLGKTNTPEWGAGSQTFNDVFGTTRNPWDTSKTCGGSSGGAATALAARLLSIADGSDMGGSLRNPASFCNVVGFRASAGRVPAVPAQMGWSSLSVLGPMARTVSDCALLLAAIAGPDPRCPISLPEPGESFLGSLDKDVSGLSVAVSQDFGGQLPVDPAVQQVVSASTSVFEQLGCQVSHSCPDFTGADEAFKLLRAWSFAARHGQAIRANPAGYKETIIWNVEQGLSLSGEDIARAETLRTQVMLNLVAFLEHHDYLVLPAAQVPPFSADDEYVSEIDGQTMNTYIDWMMSCYFVTVSGLPAISLPCGFTESGLPVGIQIVGRPHSDHDLLKMAKAFETAHPVGTRMPDLLQ